jgi:hypothetical protein
MRRNVFYCTLLQSSETFWYIENVLEAEREISELIDFSTRRSGEGSLQTLYINFKSRQQFVWPTTWSLGCPALLFKQKAPMSGLNE